MKVVLITAYNNDFDKNLALAFSKEGYKTYVMGNAGQDGINFVPTDAKLAAEAVQKDAGLVDIYIDVSNESSSADDFNVRTGINEQITRELYDANVTRPMAALEAFMPLLEAGGVKRICYLTSANASINETRDAGGFGYKTAKAALHNFLQITRNVLAPKGYTMRVFDPCPEGSCPSGREVSAPLSARAAFNYFTRGRGMERDDPYRDDEGNLVFRDAWGRQHSW